MKINVTRSSMPLYEDYINEIKELWDNRWLTNMGIKHQKFETMLMEFLETDYLSLFTNGHMGLEVAIQSFNLKGEVITTPFTFASTTHAIVRNGLTPIFCDINDQDFTIDVNKIESLINENTSAIVPVHVFGNICDIERIQEIADKHQLKVIYDAAHVFGVKHRGRGIGTYGDASMFSLHATKVFHTIEGGVVTFKDESVRQYAEAIKNFGILDQETIEYVGTNAKMNEFQASMGICNLRILEGEIKKRKVVYERYITNLKNIPGIILPVDQKSIEKNYAYFPILLDHFKKNRNELYNELKNENIFSRKYFYPLTSDFNCYNKKFDSGETPVANFVAENILTLPMYAELDVNDVDRICQIILK